MLIPKTIDENLLPTKLDALNIYSGHPEQHLIEMLNDTN